MLDPYVLAWQQGLGQLSLTSGQGPGPNIDPALRMGRLNFTISIDLIGKPASQLIILCFHTAGCRTYAPLDPTLSGTTRKSLLDWSREVCRWTTLRRLHRMFFWSARGFSGGPENDLDDLAAELRGKPVAASRDGDR